MAVCTEERIDEDLVSAVGDPRAMAAHAAMIMYEIQIDKRGAMAIGGETGQFDMVGCQDSTVETRSCRDRLEFGQLHHRLCGLLKSSKTLAEYWRMAASPSHDTSTSIWHMSNVCFGRPKSRDTSSEEGDRVEDVFMTPRIRTTKVLDFPLRPAKTSLTNCPGSLPLL
jgi:hypothetical protein